MFEHCPRLRYHIEENSEASGFNQTLYNVKIIQVEFNTKMVQKNCFGVAKLWKGSPYPSSQYPRKTFSSF